MDHLQIFVKKDGTYEGMHAADRVLVVHRYNFSDNPLNVYDDSVSISKFTQRCNCKEESVKLRINFCVVLIARSDLGLQNF